MKKIKIDKKFGPLYMPITLIGATVNDKANFFTCGWITRVAMDPPIWLFSANKERFTVSGIKANGTFSINYPGEDLIKKTDFAGIVTGKKDDKSKLFNLFYGDLKTAPLVKECLLNMELKLVEIKDMFNSLIVIGEVINIYSDEKYLQDMKPDFKKMNPFLLTMPDANYRGMGSIKGKAWKSGLS